MIQRMTWRSPTVYYSLIASGCLISLMAAYTAQYVFELHPCHLCYFHRYAYMGAGIFASMCALLSPGLFRLVTALGTTLLLTLGVGIAAHHMAVERGWVDPPHACLNAEMEGDTVEEVKYHILHEKVVPCNKVAWRLLDLSMTEWSLLNFIALWFLSLLTFLDQWKTRRRS